MFSLILARRTKADATDDAAFSATRAEDWVAALPPPARVGGDPHLTEIEIKRLERMEALALELLRLIGLFKNVPPEP